MPIRVAAIGGMNAEGVLTTIITFETVSGLSSYWKR